MPFIIKYIVVSENIFRLNLLSNKFQAQGMAKEQVIIKPHAGFQEKFVRSNVDVCFGGGCLNAGKTAGAVLMCGEPSLDPKFRAVFLRNNLGDL